MKLLTSLLVATLVLGLVGVAVGLIGLCITSLEFASLSIWGKIIACGSMVFGMCLFCLGAIGVGVNEIR